MPSDMPKENEELLDEIANASNGHEWQKFVIQLLNEFLICLKEINRKELKNKRLTEILNQIANRTDGEPNKDISELSNLTEILTLFFHEEKSKLFQKKERFFIIEILEVLKIVKNAEAINRSRGISFEYESINKLNSFLEKFNPNYQQEYNDYLKEALSKLKICVENETWNGKAKHIFTRAPDGIQKLKKILSDNSLSADKKLTALYRLVDKKYNTPSHHRKDITNNFYRNLLNNLQRFYSEFNEEKVDVRGNVHGMRYSREQPQGLTWITKNRLSQAKTLAENIEKQLKIINSQLESKPPFPVEEQRSTFVSANENKTENKDYAKHLYQVLNRLCTELNLDKWDIKGKGFFGVYKKTPDGIKKLREVFVKFKFMDVLNEESISAEQMIDLIKLFINIRQITKEKKHTVSWLREETVKEFYEGTYTKFNQFYIKLGHSSETTLNELPGNLSAIFHLISVNINESNTSLLRLLKPGITSHTIERDQRITNNEPTSAVTDREDLAIPLEAKALISNGDRNNNNVQFFSTKSISSIEAVAKQPTILIVGPGL